MHKAVWLDTGKRIERPKLLCQTAAARIITVDAAVALIGVERAVDNLVKYSPRPFYCIGSTSGYPRPSVVDLPPELLRPCGELHRNVVTSRVQPRLLY